MVRILEHAEPIREPRALTLAEILVEHPGLVGTGRVEIEFADGRARGIWTHAKTPREHLGRFESSSQSST